MEKLGTDLSALGFDLLGLGNIVYFGFGPGDDPEPDDCGESCTGGCSGGCFKCKPGNKND